MAPQANLLLIDKGVYIFALLKLQSYWAEFTKLLQNVARSSQVNILKSELRYSTLFRNAKTTNEGESADFADFNPKIGCHGNVPWAIRKRVKSVI